MQTASVQVLSNASATGSGVRWEGGRGLLTLAGTFGGTSAALQYLGPDGTTWMSWTAVSATAVQTAFALTAAGMIPFELPPGQIRVALTGGTPSAMYAIAARSS